jgi:hypothetical protein
MVLEGVERRSLCIIKKQNVVSLSVKVISD